MTIVCSFEDWKAHMLLNTPDDALVDCPQCDGTGYTDDTCACCGHELENDCPDCGGDGRVRFGDLEPGELDAYLDRARYRMAVLEDLGALANWRGVEVWEQMRDAGFASYHDIATRTLHFATESQP